MMKRDRRGVPDHALVLVVDGRFAAGSLTFACVKHHAIMVSRLRSDAVLYHRLGPRPPASTVLNPRRGSPPLFETHVEQHTRAPPRHPLSKEAANRDGRPPQKGFARGV
jgi:hypothetical protein